MTSSLDVLVTCDDAYLPHARVMLLSLKANNPERRITVHLLHGGIEPAALEELAGFLDAIDVGLDARLVPEDAFAEAPVSERYPRAMYYRLLAPHLLCDLSGRLLYLDPDILVINPVDELVDVDLAGNAFAAAAHTRATELVHKINQVRLGTTTRYLNSGVILMDLAPAREAIDSGELFDAIDTFGETLLLPDQDIFNALYASRTLEVDDVRWNYDVRNMNTYLLRNEGRATQDWVMEHTAILHFCGSGKPWDPLYPRRMGILYKHYRSIASRVLERCDARRV